MLITIFAMRFEGGVWKDWEHACTFAETEDVIDSANAKAPEHGRIRDAFDKASVHACADCECGRE